MTPDSEWGRLLAQLREETELSRQTREYAQMPRAPEPINESERGFPVTEDEE